MRKLAELNTPSSCMSRAKSDEMTFVLLGRDVAAPYAIRAWVDRRCQLGKNRRTDPQIVEALACADTMEKERLLPETHEEALLRGQNEAHRRGSLQENTK